MNDISNTCLWFVYIIEAENGFFYTGITKCIEKRFEEHQSGQAGAKFFNISKPKKVVFFEKAYSKSEALKKEAFIKKLTKKKKLEYISTGHDSHP